MMIIPCKNCIVFSMCKSKTEGLRGVGIYSYLYITCSIFEDSLKYNRGLDVRTAVAELFGYGEKNEDTM